ncbi:MAG: ATP-binding protein [Elainellaceae cyanobacterium]
MVTHIASGIRREQPHARVMASADSSCSTNIGEGARSQAVKGSSDRLKPEPLHLLLVEDDEDDYTLIEDLLSEAEGAFSLDWVTSFETAVEWLERQPYDAYLVDYRLGVKDGLELMGLIQQKYRAPVIILSGQGGREIDITALRLGASDYLDKSNLGASLLEHYICASIERNAALKSLKESEQRYRKLFKQERALRRQLSESNAELEQFAFIASHDLREPLRAIAGHMHLLVDEYGHLFDATATEYATFITGGVQRMQALIRDLLGFSRLQAILIDPSMRADCNRAVQDALTNLQAAIAESNAVITCQTLPVTVGDLSQITRLFQNLIDNALKFKRPDVRPQIAISAAIAAETTASKLTAQFGAEVRPTDSTKALWRFSVADNGIGIPPEYATEVFKTFRRLHTHQEIPGTGIGLATCQHIVQRHGGEIWLESTPGQGTTVHFTLRNSA